MINSKNILLYPLSLIYGAITSFRNFLYNTGILETVQFETPVICIGNLTVGGTGKTPHTEYVAGLLSKHFKVATLSRGYKRKSKGFRIADSNSTVHDIGDEPLQIHGKLPEIVVAVDRNKVNGVKRILNQYPETEAIILDDGFQHRKITPGFSILLTDYNRLMINDHLLPYGRLRENISNKNRADVILVTKTPSELSAIERRIIVKDMNKQQGQNLYFTTYVYGEAIPVFGEYQYGHSVDLSGSDILLVTGIANPNPLYDHLLKTCRKLEHISFSDHHDFTADDLNRIKDAYDQLSSSSKYLVTTEKDAVRLREFTNIAEPVKSGSYYIPVRIDFLNDDREEFDNIIIDYVRKNKRNHRIS
jgi:tetraacyldisaccharide 4'-kinase